MLRLFALALMVIVAALPACAQKRHALVIGIDQYPNLAERQQLRKAVGDARTIHNILGEIGFDGELIENPNRDQFDSAIDRLEATVQDGDIAFVFFSGHGIEVDNANFLLPSDVRTVDALGRPLSRRTIQAGSIDAARLVADLKAKGARTVIAVFDACRDSPFDASVTRSVGVSRGLARMQPPQGVFVMFSAGAKQRALDRLGNDDANPNSVFTRLFAPLLKQPGMSLLDIAKNIQPEVKALAASIGEEQLPAYYDEVIGQIVLVPGDRDRSTDMRLGDAAAMQKFQEERERLTREDGERKLALEEVTARVRQSMEAAEKLRRENIAQAERQSREAEEARLRREEADKEFSQKQERMKRDAEAAEERQRVAVAEANRNRERDVEVSRIKQLTIKDLCNTALDSLKVAWETSSAYADRITEAQSRGLSTEDCRREMGITNDLPLVAGINNSIWNHNGSKVRLESKGNIRRFYYVTPRVGLLQIGIKFGTLLFAGTRVGNRYEGTSYIFSPKCGAREFSVSGIVEIGDLRVVMRGQSPVIDATCSPTGSYRREELVFTYSAP